MAVPETKELKTHWQADVELPEYTMKDVAAHNTKADTWIVIRGQGRSSTLESVIKICC
jgi:cytochrome-b5 reductase